MYSVVLVGLYMYTAIDLKTTVLAIKLCHYPWNIHFNSQQYVVWYHAPIT